MTQLKLKYSDRSVFFFLGIFSTCSCLALVVGGHIISLYSITLILSFIILLRGKKRSFDIMKSRLPRLFFLWTLIGLFSSSFGIICFANEDIDWVKTIISNIPKITLYLFLFCYIAKSQKRIIYSDAIIRGLMVGIIINVFWATIDAIIFYSSRISITNELFKSFITATNTRHGMLSLILGDGVIRCAGLNGDPANIGMFAPILASYSLYSKKYWLYLLVITGILSSVSIVGLASTIIITAIYITTKGKSIIGIIAVSIVVVIIGLPLLSNNENSVSGQMIDAVVNRLEDKGDSNNQSTNARTIYWLKFLPAALNTPTSILIGTGYNTASHYYIKGGFLESLKVPYKPFDPEQTYLSFYFDLGLIGFIVFLFLHIKVLYASYKRKDEKAYLLLFAGMEGIMISFMGYHYTLYSVSMLFLISGIVLISSNNNKLINHTHFINEGINRNSNI